MKSKRGWSGNTLVFPTYHCLCIHHFYCRQHLSFQFFTQCGVKCMYPVSVQFILFTLSTLCLRSKEILQRSGTFTETTGKMVLFFLTQQKWCADKHNSELYVIMFPQYVIICLRVKSADRKRGELREVLILDDII